MSAHTDAASSRRSAWQWVAGGVAAAPALVTVAGVAVQVAVAAGPPDDWATGLSLLPLYGVVPLAAGWLATRADAPRAPIGLVAVATWAAVVQLPNASAPALSAAAGLLGLTDHTAAVTDSLPPLLWTAVMLLAARRALRARADRRLTAPMPRAGAAAAIALWAVVAVGWPPAWIQGWAGPTGGPVAAPLAAWAPASLALLIVLAVVAVIVWRRDSLLVVPAAVVVTAHAVWVSLVDAVTAWTGYELTVPVSATVASESGVGRAAQIVAAAVLAAATARLTLAAVTAWRSR